MTSFFEFALMLVIPGALLPSYRPAVDPQH
jgi:hypothetical protein